MSGKSPIAMSVAVGGAIGVGVADGMGVAVGTGVLVAVCAAGGALADGRAIVAVRVGSSAVGEVQPVVIHHNTSVRM